MDTLNFLHRGLDHRQCPQSQKVHFQQSQLLQNRHGVLGIDLPVIRTQWYIFHNRLTADNHAGGMGRGMARQAL